MISVTGQEEEAEAGGQMSVHRTQIAVLCSSKASELDAASWTCWSWHRHSAFLKLVQRLQAKLTSVFPKFDIMLCEFMPS